MNELIRALKKHVDEQEQEYKRKKYDFEAAENAYEKALTEETRRKRIILSSNFLKVIDIVHKNNFRCVCMEGVDCKSDSNSPYTNPVFTVCNDAEEYANISVEDGAVCGEQGVSIFHKRLNKIVSDVERFCETIEK